MVLVTVQWAPRFKSKLPKLEELEQKWSGIEKLELTGNWLNVLCLPWVNQWELVGSVWQDFCLFIKRKEQNEEHNYLLWLNSS